MNENAHQCILVVDDDRNLAEGLAMGLEREGRTVIICADVESAEMALARFPVTDVLSDVQFTGMFGFEGLHFLGRAKDRNAGRRTILMTGQATETLRAAAASIGAHAVLAKPFTLDELEAELRRTPAHDSSEPARIVRISTIDEIIESQSLTIAFQPIVTLGDSTSRPVAYEALTRGKRRWPLGGAAALFDYASRSSRLAELNQAAAVCAIAEAKRLPNDAAVFLNVDPVAFNGSFVQALSTAVEGSKIGFDRLVVEVTERSHFPDDEAAARLFDELRERGVRFALDDHGSSYSHLSLITRIRPSFVKISGTFGTGLERDSAKQRVVRHMVALTKDFDAQAILEGIEAAETGSAARALGVDLAQGFHFGRPRSASRWSDGSSERAA